MPGSKLYDSDFVPEEPVTHTWVAKRGGKVWLAVSSVRLPWEMKPLTGPCMAACTALCWMPNACVPSADVRNQRAFKMADC